MFTYKFHFFLFDIKMIVRIFIIVVFFARIYGQSITERNKFNEFYNKIILYADDSKPSDVVFVLDISGSAGFENFEKLKLTAETIGRLFNIFPNETHVAAVSYSLSGKKEFNFITSEEGDFCDFLSNITAIKLNIGYSSAGEGLGEAGNVLKSGRPNVNKLIFLLSAEETNFGSLPIPTAKGLKSQRMIIFCVGVAHASEKELLAIASGHDYIYFIKNIEIIKRLNEKLKIESRNRDYVVQNDRDKCRIGCDKNANCYCRSNGDYVCECDIGFIGEGTEANCKLCPKNTYKDKIGQNECTACPNKSHTLSEGAVSLAACDCDAGFIGNVKDGISCQDRKCPMLRAPVGGYLEPEICGNSIGDECSFRCEYPYCQFSNNDQRCFSEVARKPQFVRKCLISGKWSGLEFHCEDINECLVNNGNCSHGCENVIGSYFCTCPKDHFLADDGENCIHETLCCHYKKNVYNDGAMWKNKCQQCECKRGKIKCFTPKCPTIKCLETEFVVQFPQQCCPKCVSRSLQRCNVFENNSYTTFDRVQIDASFDDACLYTMTQDCEDGSFTAHVQHLKNEEKKLVVRSRCESLEITKDGKIKFNDENIRLPYKESDLIFVDREKYENETFVVVTLQSEIIIRWISKLIEVLVPEIMKDKMCGLCGNFNDQSKDDILTKNFEEAQTTTEFVNSWKISCQTKRKTRQFPAITRKKICKSANKNHWNDIKNACGILRNKNFHSCYDIIDPNNFYRLCLQKACSCVDKLCHCEVINDYVFECDKKGIFISNWKGKTNCGGVLDPELNPKTNNKM